MTGSRIYLDHAATTWPRPQEVLAGLDRYARECGATAGRGNYGSALQAADVVHTARCHLSQLISAGSSEFISFHASGTEALNVAIQGFVRPGDHVVTTAAEHNSVLRPLHYLKKKHGVHVTIVPCDNNGLVSASDIANALRDDTRMVAVTQASNVTGAVQPIQEIGDVLRDHRAIFLCDAAQTLGYLPTPVQTLGIDVLAAPGHKGAFGPAGTGMLYVRPELQDQLDPLFQGGTGSHSESLEMPTEFPDKVECGNLNVPAIAGWSEGLRLYFANPPRPPKRLAEKLYQELRSVDGLNVIGTPGLLPIASVTMPGISPSDVAAILDAEFKVETRSGYHCAALIHSYLGSDSEGTLRISCGHSTTESEIETACDALRAIVAEVSCESADHKD